MPGLVGATLRRGGYYAAMRAAITQGAERASEIGPGGILVRVKLFNLLVPELGPVLLARGVVLAREDAAALLPEVPLPPGDAAVEVRVRLADGEGTP
jgi:hypothetical protein